ncbi:hypothetical protein Sjap_011322 [Stephania japonica]|uniref:Uncharacterized protein n=1 Tax=Stephania japonica TaxID=461633 RepID=A0AAP0JC73_9MAGN
MLMLSIVDCLNHITIVSFDPECDSMFSTGLLIDGDSYGMERLDEALSAHTWPGMVVKYGDNIAEPLSEEESDFELE